MNSVMYLVFMFNLFSNVCTLILAAFSVKKTKTARKHFGISFSSCTVGCSLFEVKGRCHDIFFCWTHGFPLIIITMFFCDDARHYPM
jgi:hypothetical protein